MRIIGLVGFIGAGKNAVADILVKEYGFTREAFADPVKDAVAAIFSWNRIMLEGSTDYSRSWRESSDLYWSHKFGRPFTPREALQLMGTEIGREVYHQNLWVFSIERRMNPQKDYVISDTRFKNEIDMIHQLEGVVIRVKRGNDPFWFDDACKANKNNKEIIIPNVHKSEHSWCGCQIDFTINNDGTLEDLYNSIKKSLDDYKTL